MPVKQMLSNISPSAGASGDLPAAPETAVIANVISGDYRKDALLEGLEYRWNDSGALGSAVTVTFSFPTTAPNYSDDSATAEEANGFQAFTADQQAAVRNILTKLSLQVGIDFTEVADSASSYGTLRFSNNDQTAASSSGYAFLPNSNGESSGDLYIDLESSTEVTPGSFGYTTLIHELGHALGLKHPGNYNAGEATDATVVGNFLGVQDDKTILTLMSYRESSQDLQGDWYAPFDILTLRYLYGSRAYNATDTTYALTDLDGGKLTSLIDDGGTDTIDLSALTSGAIFNLNPGSISSFGKIWSGEASLSNLALGTDTTIENIIASAFADTITLNSVSNQLDGGAGIDTAIYSGNVNAYTLQKSGTAFLVNGASNDSDTLINVERIKFADKNLAIDLDGNAGFVAKLLGTLFGKDTIQNAEYVGLALGFVDGGMSHDELMQLALNERLGAGFSNAAEVSMLFQNLAGVAPSDAEINTYVGLIGSGPDQFTQVSLALMAADHEMSTTNINLVGLADSGLVYV